MLQQVVRVTRMLKQISQNCSVQHSYCIRYLCRLKMVNCNSQKEKEAIDWIDMFVTI